MGAKKVKGPGDRSPKKALLRGRPLQRTTAGFLLQIPDVALTRRQVEKEVRRTLGRVREQHRMAPHVGDAVSQLIKLHGCASKMLERFEGLEAAKAVPPVPADPTDDRWVKDILAGTGPMKPMGDAPLVTAKLLGTSSGLQPLKPLFVGAAGLDPAHLMVAVVHFADGALANLHKEHPGALQEKRLAPEEDISAIQRGRIWVKGGTKSDSEFRYAVKVLAAKELPESERFSLDEMVERLKEFKPASTPKALKKVIKNKLAQIHKEKAQTGREPSCGHKLQPAGSLGIPGLAALDPRSSTFVPCAESGCPRGVPWTRVKFCAAADGSDGRWFERAGEPGKMRWAPVEADNV